MAQLGTGTQGERRNRAAALLRHSGGAQTSRPEFRAPTSEAPAARAAREIAVQLGDSAALEERRLEEFDYLCAGGQMWVAAGSMFCKWPSE